MLIQLKLMSAVWILRVDQNLVIRNKKKKTTYFKLFLGASLKAHTVTIKKGKLFL